MLCQLHEKNTNIERRKNGACFSRKFVPCDNFSPPLGGVPSPSTRNSARQPYVYDSVDKKHPRDTLPSPIDYGRYSLRLPRRAFSFTVYRVSIEATDDALSLSRQLSRALFSDLVIRYEARIASVEMASRDARFASIFLFYYPLIILF